MSQLRHRATFKPMKKLEMSEAQLKQVLRSHLFLKKKRDGTIKGRTVVGGNKQRDYITKEEASSPTASTEAVLLTCIVDAEERRNVTTLDIPNAFITTVVEKEEDRAIIELVGYLVEVLLDIDPDYYKDYV